MRVLAFDFGGTRLKAGIVEGAQVVAQQERDAPPGDGALRELVSVGRDLLADARPDAVGLAVPGLVEDGEVVSLPGKHEGLVGVDLAKGLRDAFDAPAIVVNDAIAYGVGEARAGAGASYERVVVVTIGTGIGVAVIEHGQPVTSGMLGGGILGGMIPIGADGTDTAGYGGTIEALCRAERIAHLARAPSVPDAFRAYEQGDAHAHEGIETYRGDLARALVALAHAHAPGCIVVGGGPITEASPILEGIEELVRARLFPGYSVDVRAAGLGGAAALVGLSSLCAR